MLYYYRILERERLLKSIGYYQTYKNTLQYRTNEMYEHEGKKKRRVERIVTITLC